MIKKAAILALIFTAALSGLMWLKKQNISSNLSTDSSQSTGAAVKKVTPQQFAELAQAENTFVIDVHTPEQTHIPGTDAVIPSDQISNRINELPADKSTPILVYCRSGGMSAEASAELANLGYTNVSDLIGGTNAYQEQQVSVQLWPAEQDLGTVIYGDVTKTSYTLTNYGPLPTKITRVSTSCGCTKAEAVDTELGAYESTTIHVSFDPAVHKDDTDLGDLTRNIYIETDNPNFPKLEARFTATVIKND